jgi:Mg/Co/Ni transporter MgtE
MEILKRTARDAFSSISVEESAGQFMDRVIRLGGNMTKNILRLMQTEKPEKRMKSCHYDRQKILSQDLYEKEICALIILLTNTDATDAYWDLTEYRQPKFISKFTGEQYNVTTDKN